MPKYILIKVAPLDWDDGTPIFVIKKDGKQSVHCEDRNPIGLAKDILNGWEIEGIGLIVDRYEGIVVITNHTD